MSRINERQRRLFDALSNLGRLNMAISHPGVTCHIVERCYLTSTESEDRLDFGDGTQHVHVDWTRVTRVQPDVIEGKAALSFMDGDQVLFRLYKPDGDFPAEVHRWMGRLTPPGIR